MASRPLSFAVIALLVACDRYPRDPAGTLERVNGGTLRVGVIERPPWTIRTSGEPEGAEPELVRGFAADVHAKHVAWVPGAAEDLLGALERRDLDLVIGGLAADDPWTKRIGPTRAYYTERLCVGTTDDEPHFEPKGRRITTHDGEPLAAVLTKKGADVVRVPILRREDAPIGAPEWQIHAWGLHVAACPEERAHILAVAPGENAFALRLERVLATRRHEVPTLLKQALAAQEAREQRGAALP